MRFPVAAQMALQTAGAIGGVPGSPMPPHLRLALMVRRIASARKEAGPVLRRDTNVHPEVAAHPPIS